MIKLFGTTIRETSKVLTTGIHAGGDQVTQEDKIKAIGRLIVTILLIFLATFLFTSGNNELGGTIVGTITGYWMK